MGEDIEDMLIEINVTREVYEKGTVGSDHYPIFSRLDVGLPLEDTGSRWTFKKANWERFRVISDDGLKSIHK